jgi:hypothetical protein
MRTAGFLLALAGTLGADVVVLKDGGKVAGRVTDKGPHYEVSSDAGLRTYLKEEVDKVLTSPRELLGDSEKLVDEAKLEYEAALAAPAAEQNARLKAAIGKATRAREAYAAARELFPEEKHADLDTKLVQVMQLLRLLRERVGSEVARRPGSAVINAPPPLPLPEATAILSDAVRRGDPLKRLPGRDAFRAYRAMHPEFHDLATAAMIYLSRPEADWRLDPAGQKALQEYFAKPWIQDPLKLTPEAHLEAATFLADRVAAIRKAAPQAPVEPLALFGAGHLGHAAADPKAEAAARAFGIVPQGGALGTPEGHAVRDMAGWIASGDFDLAVLSFVKEHRATDTPAVRFVWSYALLRLVQKKERGFERPVAALQTVKSPEAAVNDHAAALARSIKAVASCSSCGGQGRFRCTNCFGRKEIRYNCAKCNGTGKTAPAGAAGRGFNRFVEPVDCYPCRGRGFDKLLRCEKCKDGSIDCKQCEKPAPPPSMEDIAASTPCAPCEGRGLAFRKVLWPCRNCLGVGVRFAPKADPAKVLP